MVHVLSLTRWLQDVAARRLLAARRIAAAMKSKQAAAGGLEPESRAADMARQELASRALHAMFDVVRKEDNMGPTIKRLMNLPQATLWVNGASVRGCSGWHHELSINATDLVLYSPSRVLVTHWVDTTPFRPTAEEQAKLEALRADLGDSSRSHSTMEMVRANFLRPLTEEEKVRRCSASQLYCRFFLLTMGSAGSTSWCFQDVPTYLPLSLLHTRAWRGPCRCRQ